MPAPVEDVQPTTTIVLIRNDKVDPPVFDFVPFDPVLDIAKVFSLESALTLVGVGQPSFYWYYDYDAKNVLDAYVVCGDRPQCNLFVCTLRDNKASEHRLLAIAASRSLNQKPKDPFDFPDGTVFDIIEWRIRVGPNICPSTP